MKKIILIGMGVCVGVIALAAVAFFVWLNSMLPATEERVSFGNAEIIESIDKQLADVDVEAVRAKSDLMRHKTISEIQESIKDKQFTYEELTAYYLLNIKENDQSPTGNNAVSEVNPNAIAEARKFDRMTEDMPFKGIPVLAKENINTNDMPTSSGVYALKDYIPAEDAPVIAELKANGALILGKTNLSELSNWMSQKNPSGYSAKKGQTHNPFNPLAISPLGSSAGSAVAMATDLAAVTLGTETVGSIVAPASINSTVGYKPTRDNISGEKVVPISLSLDTVGVITKTVQDAASTYNASTPKTLDIELDKDYIAGKRIGILDSKDSEFSKSVKAELEKMGATVVELGAADDSGIDASFILHNDFERDLNAYLQENNAPIKSLEELIAYNKKDEQTRMRYGQSHLEKSLAFKDHDDKKVQDTIRLAEQRLNQILDDNQLDAVVSQDNNGVVLSAVAGAPEISVPFGKNDTQPIGATFAGKVNSDAELLKIAYSFEQNTQMRLIPGK